MESFKKQFVMAILLAIMPVLSMAAAKGEIAFLAIQGAYWQVWLMDADGSNARAISSTPYDKSRLSWYKNGDLLVNGVQGELVRLSLSDKSETPVKFPYKSVNDVVISPDEKYFSFSQKPEEGLYSKLWLLEIESGLKSEIGWKEKGFQHEPVFSPDSQKLYFLSGDNGQNHDVMEYDLVSRRLKALTSAGLYNLDIAVNNKFQFLYSSNRKGHYDIWYQDEKQIKQLTDRAALDGRPVWGGNNKTVYFESSYGGVLNIWSMKVGDKVEPVQLTDNKKGARYPLWRNKPSGVKNYAEK